MTAVFLDRKQAGQMLAKALTSYADKNVIVLALPRGGVVLGLEIALALKAPLNLLFAHKIGHPLHTEYAIAAISEGGEVVGNEQELSLIDKKWLEEKKRITLETMKEKRKFYLKNRKKPDLDNKTVILVDDGVATGLTLFSAILELKQAHPKKIVIAVPVVSKSTAVKIQEQVDALVALQIEVSFLGSVGSYYKNFPQVEDAEVISLLEKGLPK